MDDESILSMTMTLDEEAGMLEGMWGGNRELSFPCPSYEKNGLRCIFESRSDYKCGETACVIKPPHQLERKT